LQGKVEKPQNKEWHDQIFESLGHLFAGRAESNLYGSGHAQAVEAAVLDVLAAPEHERIDGIDVPVLQSAALLHDAGFARRAKSWSLDCLEHVEAGKQLASEILARNARFRGNPERIRQVLWLIEHHDDTTYSFPSATRDGRPMLPGRAQEGNGLDTSLAILQEADSRVHVADACIQEASQEWRNKGIPLFADCGAPLATWRWMDSVVGNIRLLGKRAVLDAHTQSGNLIALDAYHRLEDHIGKQCDLDGVPYEAEVCPPAMRLNSIERLASKSFELEIVAFHNWDELDRILRSVPLLYDRAIHPYRGAMLESRLVDLDALSPMALYVMRNRLEEVLELHDALMVTYCLGIWDLPGLLEFRYNSAEVQIISPPIVEKYVETAHPDNPHLMGLLDGLHRCSVARDTRLSRVRAIVASDVPFPLVPLPVDWEEIRTYENHNPPARHMKRRFRYQALADFPFESCLTSTAVTEDNFQYFFYRDSSLLGSTGKRNFNEFETQRAH
jgi:hypothetical protein